MPYNTQTQIITKAREGLDLSIRALADQASVSPQTIVMIEDGRLKCQESVAEALNLSFEKMREMAHNYSMESKLSSNLGLRRYEVAVGGIVANCYIVLKDQVQNSNVNSNPKSKCPIAILIDAVGVSDQAMAQIVSNAPQALLITHGHFDHVAGMEIIKQRFPEIKVVEAGKDVKTDGPIDVSGFSVKTLKTPGHTEDAVCYLVDDQILFTGDTLFAGSIGKPNYNYQLLLKNIKQKIFSLPDDVIIAPGHGPLTTVKFEQHNNPFF